MNRVPKIYGRMVTKILKRLSGAMTEKIIKYTSNVAARRKTEISSPLPNIMQDCRITVTLLLKEEKFTK